VEAHSVAALAAEDIAAEAHSVAVHTEVVHTVADTVAAADSDKQDKVL
jgi:hypothetical protein